MKIRRTRSGIVVVCTASRDGFDDTTDLPGPEQFLTEAIRQIVLSNDPEHLEAAGMLGRCDLSYEVAVDEEGSEADRLRVVIAAPTDVYDVLTDHFHPATAIIMLALLDACPAPLGGDRVVRKPEDAA